MRKYLTISLIFFLEQILTCYGFLDLIHLDDSQCKDPQLRYNELLKAQLETNKSSTNSTSQQQQIQSVCYRFKKPELKQDDDGEALNQEQQQKQQQQFTEKSFSPIEQYVVNGTCPDFDAKSDLEGLFDSFGISEYLKYIPTGKGKDYQSPDIMKSQFCFTDFECETGQFCYGRNNTCQAMASLEVGEITDGKFGFNYECKSLYSDNYGKCVDVGKFLNVTAESQNKQKIDFCEKDKQCPDDRLCIDFWGVPPKENKKKKQQKKIQKVCQTQPLAPQINYAQFLVDNMIEEYEKCKKKSINVQQCEKANSFKSEFEDLSKVQSYEPNFSMIDALTNSEQTSCIQSQFFISDSLKQIFTPSQLAKLPNKLPVQEVQKETNKKDSGKKQQKNKRILKTKGSGVVYREEDSQSNDGGLKNGGVSGDGENIGGDSKKLNEKSTIDSQIVIIFFVIIGLFVVAAILYKIFKRWKKGQKTLDQSQDNTNLIYKPQTLALEKNVQHSGNNSSRLKENQPIVISTQEPNNHESDIREQIQKMDLEGHQLETSVDKKFFVIDNENDDEEEASKQQDLNEDSVQYSNVFNLEGESSQRPPSSARKRRFKNTYGSKQNLNQEMGNQENGSVIEYNTQQN